MNRYDRLIERGEELFQRLLKSISADKVQEQSIGEELEPINEGEALEIKEWVYNYRGISIDKAWRRVWYARYRRQIYGWSSAAVILLLVALTLFIPKQVSQEILVAEQVIMPAYDNIILRTSKGETIVVDSIQSLDTIISNASVSKTEIMYQSESREITKTTLQESIKNEKEMDMNELYVPKGRVFSLVLSDGTKVWLNSESLIQYPVNFDQGERIVTISGEAFFDVAKTGNRFIVKTTNYEVNVLGTKFNIISYENENISATTLIEGSVSMTRGEESEFKISPGEQFSLDKTSNVISVKKVDVNLFTSWINNQLRLSHSKLEDIFRVLQRKYDIHVFFSDENAKNELFSGEVPLNDNLKVILDQLSKVSDVEFQIEGKLVVIRYK